MFSDDVSIADSNSSPVVGVRGSKSASPSPVHSGALARGSGSISSADWQTNEDDIDRLVAMHQNRTSLSSLGVSSFKIKHQLVIALDSFPSSGE